MVKKKHDFKEMISKAVPYDEKRNSFREILFVPTKKKHPDSGFGLFDVYGLRDEDGKTVCVKICDCSDIISLPYEFPLSLEEQDGIVGVFSFCHQLLARGKPFTSTFYFGIEGHK